MFISGLAPFWFHPVNRLKTNLQGLIQTGLSLTNGIGP